MKYNTILFSCSWSWIIPVNLKKKQSHWDQWLILQLYLLPAIFISKWPRIMGLFGEIILFFLFEKTKHFNKLNYMIIIVHIFQLEIKSRFFFSLHRSSISRNLCGLLKLEDRPQWFWLALHLVTSWVWPPGLGDTKERGHQHKLQDSSFCGNL